jgi:hypothetical protein
MEAFCRIMRPKPETRILDLGGRPEIWQLIDIQADVTLLNLSEDISQWNSDGAKRFTVVTGDACTASMFADNAFDIVFSNSVIEHLPAERWKEFALTAQRLAPAWWIQTPAPCFPVEAHCNLPFWWFYPNGLRRWCLKNWQRKGNYYLWRQMLTTSALNCKTLNSLFPNANIFTETVLGIPKSYCIFRGGVVAT